MKSFIHLLAYLVLRMKVDFFTFGGRKYINNAVVSAHILEFIRVHFSSATDFRLKFQKPFFANAEFILSTEEISGYFVGKFTSHGTQFYFSYNPVPGEVVEKEIDNISDNLDMFMLSHFIMDTNAKMIIRSFEEKYGPMTKDDKNIFVIQEIVDTSIMSDIIVAGKMPQLNIIGPHLIDDRRYKSEIYLNNKFLGYRYNTVKKFSI